jgi:soluble lytic murein transglycosylase-like protein
VLVVPVFTPRTDTITKIDDGYAQLAPLSVWNDALNFRRSNVNRWTTVLMVITTAVLSAAPATAGWPWSKRSEQTRSAVPVPVPKELRPIIDEAARKYSLDPQLIAAVTFHESAFDVRAVSSRGAQGLMQLMPRTARSLGVRDAFDPRQNILGGAKYLRQMFDLFGGDLDKSLAAYNAGPEAVKRKGVAATDEAVRYVRIVKGYYGKG